MIVSVDFETRSAVDLRKTGVYIYADDPSTDVWCMAYAFDDEEPKVWTPADPIDTRLEDYIVEGGKLRAWNSSFERVIWNKIMTPRYNWPRTGASQWFCTMAQASAMGLPRALGQAADVLGVEQQKDKTGQALMMRMARPRRTNPDGSHVWWDTPDKMAALISYCLQDVRTEISVAERLVEMDAQERQVFLLDQRINDRGIMLDRDLLDRV
jgi:DNA polymerase